MVEVDRGDDAEQGPIDDIGGIQPAAETDLDDGKVRRGLAHGHKGRGRGALEHRRLAATAVDGGLDPVEDGIQGLVPDQLARQPDPLVEPHQMGRGIAMDPQARRLGDGPDEGDGRTLAVGAGNMDDGRQPVLRITQRRTQDAHPVQRQVDPLRMPRAQSLGDRVHRT